jgi:hypothetical protein
MRSRCNDISRSVGTSRRSLRSSSVGAAARYPDARISISIALVRPALHSPCSEHIAASRLTVRPGIGIVRSAERVQVHGEDGDPEAGVIVGHQVEQSVASIEARTGCKREPRRRGETGCACNATMASRAGPSGPNRSDFGQVRFDETHRFRARQVEYPVRVVHSRRSCSELPAQAIGDFQTMWGA